jgi:hypothetical protein
VPLPTTVADTVLVVLVVVEEVLFTMGVHIQTDREMVMWAEVADIL